LGEWTKDISVRKISPDLILFYRKYEGTLRHNIHYILSYQITASFRSERKQNQTKTCKKTKLPSLRSS